MSKTKEHDQIIINIGREIGKRRRELGLTQEEFANKIGVSYGYYVKIEAPNVPMRFSMETLLDICDGLGCKLKDLIQ